MKIRIACLQLNPQIRKIEENISKATSLIERYWNSSSVRRDPPHILVLPELAFTGYNYHSRQDIVPYLEKKTSGISTKWAQTVSKKLGCYTIIGYPEKYSPRGSNTSDFSIYNSASVVSPTGTVLFNYRKTHLYTADETWGCSESPEGFTAFDGIKIYDPETGLSKSITISIGICMDLNPYKFTESPFEAFEFANNAKTNNAQVLICPMAWLSTFSPNVLEENENMLNKKSSKQKQQELLQYQAIFDMNPNNFEPKDSYPNLKDRNCPAPYDPHVPDERTVDYWLLRNLPFVNYTHYPNNNKKRTVFVSCNRTGLEDNVLYAGSSSIAVFNGKTPSEDPSKSDISNWTQIKGNPSIDLMGSLGQGEEGILQVEVEI